MRLLVLCFALAGCCEFSGPRYHGRKSDHFDGLRFHNALPSHVSDVDIVRWRLTRHPGAWPEYAEVPPAPKPPERSQALRITFVNHATVLIQMAGVNLLTDPIWGDITGPTRYTGRKRHRAPGLRLEDLPPIDAVLLSHDHYDHLDIPTLERVHPRRIVAGLGMAQLLEEYRLGPVVELDWGKWTPVGPLRVFGVPARHNCRRGACDADARLWLGFLIRAVGYDVYFAGDTGMTPHFQQIVDRFGPPEVALLPISPGTPHELFAPVHLDAAEAVEAARILRARVAIPIHFGTFAQGDEGDGEAEAKLRARADSRWVVLHNGETWTPTSSRAGGGS